jgi:outer membrane protein TolC
MRILKLIVATSLLLVPVLAFAQQPITLAEAVRIALEKNPLRKAAMADTRVAAAEVREARAGLLPRIMFSESAIRSNDPVFAFGTKLRQQSFSAADFALNQLNTPTPIGNFSSRFSGQWRLFDSFQSYRSIERARKMNDASRDQLERADQELIARVVQSYYGLLLARRRVSVAEDASKTAKSIEEHSRNRVESGLAVDADLLSAQVLAANREQELIRARNDLSYAGVALAITLGLSTEATPSPSEVLADRSLPPADISDLDREALQHRPDLRRLRSEQSAQQQSVSMAKSAFGPRLDAFGSWQTDSRSLGWNGGNNWTAGVELQLDLFSGGAKLAQLQRERATSDRIASMRSAFEDQVRLEVRRAYYDHDSARQQVAVAKAASEQAAESLRILSNRYDAGLATVTDLLRVEEAAHRAQSDYWDAVYRTQTTYANLQLAAGTLTPDSAVVMP